MFSNLPFSVDIADAGSAQFAIIAFSSFEVSWRKAVQLGRLSYS